MQKFLAPLAAAAALVAVPAQAAIDVYVAPLFGFNEVGFPATGDPDAFGVASLSIDNVANTVSWAILVNNLTGGVTGAHIHVGAAGTNGPVRVDFSGALTGSGLFDPDLAAITPATAAGYYVNVHTTVYPAGAVRGQLAYVTTVSPIPEPGSAAMLAAGLGAVGLLAARRRRT